MTEIPAHLLERARIVRDRLADKQTVPDSSNDFVERYMHDKLSAATVLASLLSAQQLRSDGVTIAPYIVQRVIDLLEESQ